MLRQLLFLLLLHSCSAQQQGNAALIFGGFASGIAVGTVELYGCQGGGGISIDLANMTKSGYLISGQYRADDDDVLVCGGYNCGPSACRIDGECRAYNPRSKVWDYDSVGNMITSKQSYLLARGPNLDTGNNALHPIAVGYQLSTEIYDKQNNNWTIYRALPERNWYTVNCLFQDREDHDLIYNIRTSITRLDVRNWTLTDLGVVPAAFVAPGRCIPVTIGGHRGIFIRHGYFYDHTLRDWVRKAPPPHYVQATQPNAMWSFNGRPTIFGNNKCDNHGVCVNTEVVQYVSETDTWIFLADLSHSRTYHEMVEVPGSWCDHFVTAPTSTSTSTSTTTTTATSTSTTTTTTRTTTRATVPTSTTTTATNPAATSTTSAADKGIAASLFMGFVVVMLLLNVR